MCRHHHHHHHHSSTQTQYLRWALCRIQLRNIYFTVCTFFSARQNGCIFSSKKPLLMQSPINKTHWPHSQIVESFIKRTDVQEVSIERMMYLSLPPLSNEIWPCQAVIQPFFLPLVTVLMGFHCTRICMFIRCFHSIYCIKLKVVYYMYFYDLCLERTKDAVGKTIRLGCM